MKGLKIYSVHPSCDDNSIIACLNLYGNLISYQRLGSRILIAYDKQLETPLPLVWCRDYRLNVAFAHAPIMDRCMPPLIPHQVQQRVRGEFKKFEHCLEYIITGYPRSMNVDQLRIEIIIRFGHFVTIEFKQKITFAFFDRMVRIPSSGGIKIELSKQSKRKYEQTEVCLNCDAFNPRGFDTCVLCMQQRCRCIMCKRENLPNFKFCNYCGLRQCDFRSENSIKVATFQHYSKRMAYPLISLLLFCYCSIAFYVAITNYVTDANDRAIIQSQLHPYNDKLLAARSARGIETSCTVKTEAISTLTEECTILHARQDNVTEALPNVTYYDEMYAAQRECNARIDALNATFQALKANASIHTLNNGYCQMFTDLAMDHSVLFFYRRAVVNGFDFYYYRFPTSQVLATNGTIVTLENCVPYIFNGPPIRQGYKSGIIGASVDAIDFGSNMINITLSSGFQSIQLQDFQFWSRGI